MTKTINPGNEAVKMLLEAAQFARQGDVQEASVLAGISANLAEYGFEEYELED